MEKLIHLVIFDGFLLITSDWKHLLSRHLMSNLLYFFSFLLSTLWQIFKIMFFKISTYPILFSFYLNKLYHLFWKGLSFLNKFGFYWFTIFILTSWAIFWKNNCPLLKTKHLSTLLHLIQKQATNFWFENLQWSKI